jgi:enoyl-CoA hydratase
LIARDDEEETRTTMTDYVHTERDADVTTITIRRPEKLNALDAKVLTELVSELHELVATETPPRAAILTGEGKAFVAGADIAGMAELSPAHAKAFAELGHAVGTLIETAPFPVIAAVNGFALGGGCELALACDFIYASERAKFGQPEVKLGVIPGFGGTQRLARRVGLGRARELVYTGDMIDAAEALRIGLVNAVVPADQLLAKAMETAKKIAAQGPLAVAAAKRVMLNGADADLRTANELEATAFAALFGSADQREGMRAFIDKRSASFTGK